MVKFTKNVMINLVALIALLSGFIAFIMKHPEISTPLIIAGVVLWFYVKNFSSEA